LREALSQPRLWVADVIREWQVCTVWRGHINDVPAHVLPKPGVMLTPELDAILTVRLVGGAIGRARTPSSVLKIAIEGVEKAFKKLAEFVLHRSQGAGRPSKLLRYFYDLPAQHLAYNSFEIAFRDPLSVNQRRLTDEDAETFRRMGKLLSQGLDWASDPESAPLQIDAEERLVVLEALKHLTPSTQGDVDEIHVGGRILGAKRPVARLTRATRRRVTAELRQAPERAEVVNVVGIIGEADRDRSSFTLRYLEDDGTIPETEMEFVFGDELLDDVIDAFSERRRVRVIGRVFTAGTYDVLLLSPAEEKGQGRG
jgi:hypothetical protein